MSGKRVASIVLNNFMNDSRVLKESSSLAENGFDVTVVALRLEDEPPRETIGKVKVRRLKMATWGLPEGKVFGALKYTEIFLAVFFRYRSYDIWHCNDFTPLFFAWLSRPFRLRKKVVYDSHEYQRERLGLDGINKWFVVKFEPMAIRVADAVITVSDGIVKEYKRIFNLDEVHLILNAPAFRERYRPGKNLRNKFQISDDKVIFISSGGITHGRNIEKLLEAFAKRKDDKAVLIFLGYGPLVDLVEDYAARHPNIFHHPAVSTYDVCDLVAEADFGLMSVENICLNYYHSMPNKLFEYIQARIPILTADLKDCRELIEKEGIGISSSKSSVSGWNELIDKALEMGSEEFTEALDDAAQRFHWENEEKKLLEIYHSL